MYYGTEVTSPECTFAVSVLMHGVTMNMYKRLDGQVYVAGSAGQPYTLRVRNLTHGRIELISSVDGRHTLRDEPASLSSRGLILHAPSGRGDDINIIKGWRENDETTREFIFGSPEQSIAARATGSTANIGIIGFAVWREREHNAFAAAATSVSPHHRYVAGKKSVSMSAPSASMGTGIGARQHDPVGRTQFTRQHGKCDMLSVMYDSMEHLEAIGITGPPDPNPFPGNNYPGYGEY